MFHEVKNIIRTLKFREVRKIIPPKYYKISQDRILYQKY